MFVDERNGSCGERNERSHSLDRTCCSRIHLLISPRVAPSPPLPSATPEVNRFWRRLIWDDELKRLYSHLDGVTHSIDSHQKPLYLENTFHDQARDRSTQIYADRIARENIGMFKRLMAVHTRKPREFLTHHVQNPKTHSRFLEYQRVQEDNHRLVERLLSAKTFLNDRGSLDEHALAHEQLLLRLSHNPKNCFVPDLHVKRKQDQKRMREESIALQALKKIQSKPLSTHAQTQAQLERVQRELDSSGIHVHKSWLGDPQAPTIRSPKYSYPLPPGSPTETNGQMELKPHPTVLLPYGTHLVAPALVDQGQYDSLSRSLAGLDTTHQPIQPVSPPKGARTYAASGDMEDANLTLTMPPPSTIEFGGMSNGVFYLRPHSLGGASHQPDRRRSRDSSPSKPVLASESIEYPFRFPPLEGRDGARLGQQQYLQYQQHVLEGGSEQSEEKQQADTDVYGQQQQIHRRTRSSGTAQPQMMHSDDLYDGRASTAQPSARSHNPHPSTSSFATPTHPPHPPSMGSSHSQAFLDFFGGSQNEPISLRSVRGAPPGTAQPQAPSQGRRGKGLSTGRTKASLPPIASTSTANAFPPLSLGSMTSRSHRFHHDYPSAFTHAHSTAVAHPSVAGPRRSKTSRRSAHEKLEAYIDELILSGERQQENEIAQQQQQMQEVKHAKLQPRPPTTQTQEESKEQPTTEEC